MKIISGGIILVFSMLFADQRHFVWTYEYKTVSKGEVEFEHYYTTSYRNSSDLSEVIKTGHQLELEIGMNEKYDFAVYHQFEQENSFVYKGYKLRWRYRIGEKNQYLLDPLLYFTTFSNLSPLAISTIRLPEKCLGYKDLSVIA